MFHYQEANFECWSCLQKQSWYKITIVVTIVWMKLEQMSSTSSNRWVAFDSVTLYTTSLTIFKIRLKRWLITT